MIQPQPEWCKLFKEQQVARGSGSLIYQEHLATVAEAHGGEMEPARLDLGIWAFAKCAQKHDADSDTPGSEPPSCLHSPVLSASSLLFPLSSAVK